MPVVLILAMDPTAPVRAISPPTLSVPLTINDVNVPTLLILPWVLPVTVTAVVAVLAVLAESAMVAELAVLADPAVVA